MTVELTDEATEQLAGLPRVIRQRVTLVLERLTHWPAVSGIKALRGNLAGYYRLRTGDYRIQFLVHDQVVTVVRIGHRDGFYED